MMLPDEDCEFTCLPLPSSVIIIVTISANAQTLHKAYEKQLIGRLYIQF